MPSYFDLAAFAQSHKSDPLGLAKIMVAWTWTSVLPGGYGPEPTSGKSVATGLTASCGWRDILLEQLFSEIGVQHRRVNFHDVPFQTNHSATELLINGKWMFFDATFGIYLERKGGGTPLSMAEARNLWPDVVVKQCSLPGWQGVFVDPNTISASSYQTKADTFAYQPHPFTSRNDVVSGELNSLYFGPKATYLDNGLSQTIPTTTHTWKTYTDTGKQTWKKIVDFFDASGRPDFRQGLFDDSSRWFVDWDQKGKHSWAEKWTYTNASSLFDCDVTIYDDRSRLVTDNDETGAQAWARTTVHYDTMSRADFCAVAYDDGQMQLVEWDQFGSFNWSTHSDLYDASGVIMTSDVTYRDGTAKKIDWSNTAHLDGTPGADVMSGTSGTDLLRSFDGNDVLIGGAGTDRLEGGPGNDIYYMDAADFVIEKPNEGIDAVVASVSYVLGVNLENLVLGEGVMYGTGNELDNAITGNFDGNVIGGNAGNDNLYGLGGDDLLTGASGNDALQGGLGADTLWGGAGADTFYWQALEDMGTSRNTADLVMDFSRAARDRLNFAQVDADVTKVGNQAFTFVGDAGFTDAGQLRYVVDTAEILLLINTDADISAEAAIRLATRLKPEASWFVL